MAGSPLKRLGLACQGKTNTGRPCNCREVYPNGFCRFHGGEGESPLVAIRATAKEKFERRRKTYLVVIRRDLARLK